MISLASAVVLLHRLPREDQKNDFEEEGGRTTVFPTSQA
jgi:hypothetical protein